MVFVINHVLIIHHYLHVSPQTSLWSCEYDICAPLCRAYMNYGYLDNWHAVMHYFWHLLAPWCTANIGPYSIKKKLTKKGKNVERIENWYTLLWSSWSVFTHTEKNMFSRFVPLLVFAANLLLAFVPNNKLLRSTTWFPISICGAIISTLSI